MKKIILLAIAFTFVNVLVAQTNKGDWMVGGAFNLNTSGNNTVIALSPNAGTFIIDNLALGANIGLEYRKTGDLKVTSFGIGPWLRYYFTEANVRPILQGNFNFLSATTKSNGFKD